MMTKERLLELRALKRMSEDQTIHKLLDEALDEIETVWVVLDAARLVVKKTKSIPFLRRVDSLERKIGDYDKS